MLVNMKKAMPRAVKRRRVSRGVFFAFAAAFLWIPISARNRQASQHGWLPNHQTAEDRFVGNKVCAGCHAAEAEKQQKTPMALATEMPSACGILQSHWKMTFKEGPFSYEIYRDGDRSFFKVTDGKSTIVEPILYAMGGPIGGQTYVLKHEGQLIEARYSYFKDIDGLDLTIGHPREVPSTIVAALGMPMYPAVARLCFGCHTTNAVLGTDLRLDSLVPGVQCEQCHGPGTKHVQDMEAGNFDKPEIFNPGKLGTDDISNFCGNCHRTWEQVITMNLRGVMNVRFQPYRLANSKCYDPDDPRISCIACHDPHKAIRTDTSFYDSKCTACHALKGATAKPQPAGQKQAARTYPPCPVAKSNCTTCHMPRMELPGAHLKFSDHEIRIVRKGDQYPN